MSTPVQSLLSRLGYSPFYSEYCDCTNSKFCSSSTPTVVPPADQYSICEYWSAAVTLNYLPNPPGAWISGATDTGAIAASEADGALSEAASAAGIAIPGVSQIISVVTNLFAGAHAKAQRAQANAIVDGIPYANSVLRTIQNGIQAGVFTLAGAQAAYQELQDQFTALMKQGTSYKPGDALWTCDIALQLVIANQQATVLASSSVPIANETANPEDTVAATGGIVSSTSVPTVATAPISSSSGILITAIAIAGVIYFATRGKRHG